MTTDADPKSDLKIRSVPRSVRLEFGAQAKAQGIYSADHLAALVALWRQVKQQ